jgi:hypothetical protein
MANQEMDDLFEDTEEGKIDELELEIFKEEKKTKPPLPISRIVLIFVAILVGTSGLSIGIAALIARYGNSIYAFYELVSIMFMVFAGLVIIASGISGFWGGQRNIPIRLVSPADASVVGRGLIICGYVIEDCMDNEIELTIFDKEEEEALLVRLLPINEEGLFYTELDSLSEEKKTTQHVVEAWMVSVKSKERKILVREKKLDQMNVANKGLKIGKWHLFPRIYKDFADKVKIIFDPKRKEKGMIENVNVDGKRVTNIFFPSKSDDEEYVPFSFEKIAEMKQNAYYFDVRRSRRTLLSLLFFLTGLAYFIYPIITIFI